MFLLDPSTTFFILVGVQTAHLAHHRLAKRHISFAEVVSSATLLLPTSGETIPAALVAGVHLLAAGVQVVGSIWIRRLSPDWSVAA